MRKILAVLVLMVFILAGCSNSNSSVKSSGASGDIDKMIGKWEDKQGFTTEISYNKTDGYVLDLGDTNDIEKKTDLIIKHGTYDKKTKRLTFIEDTDRKDRRPHEFWYDGSTDELIYTHQDGTTDRTQRAK